MTVEKWKVIQIAFEPEGVQEEGECFESRMWALDNRGQLWTWDYNRPEGGSGWTRSDRSSLLQNEVYKQREDPCPK